MRLRIIIVISAVIVSISILAAWLYINSFQFVTISYNRSYGTITMTGGNLERPLVIVSGTKMKLKKGHYQLAASGTNVRQTTEDLQVGGQPIVKNIYIALSDEFLKKQLANEEAAIQQAILEQYPVIANLYTINHGKLYGRGEWYGTVLTYRGSDSDNRDSLRILLQKDGRIWHVITTPPEPLLSAKKLPNVPSYILSDINQPAYLPGTATSPAIQPE